jgi:hypothetical protein
MRIPMKWRVPLAALAASVLASIGLTPAPAMASTMATPSFGAANSISYGDSDFEGTIGDWVNVANATLSDDTTTAFLHADSLKAVAGTTSAMQFKLGNQQQIGVNGGSIWRVGAWFKAPALSGRTITWALATYTPAGTFIAWSSAATADTLSSSGGWQYATADIQLPSNAAYMLGSPRVTENGQAAGEALNMDEVWLSPKRPALMMGADAGSSGDASLWSSANTSIGPLQEDKIFYNTLPAAVNGVSGFVNSTCDNLPPNVTCVIAYNTPTTNLMSFISGIPSTRNVIFDYHQEPENGDYTSGATFVGEFEGQSSDIRLDSGNAPNIFVAEDSSSSGYGPGQPGADCSVSAHDYIVPPAYVDFYAVDHYEFDPNGENYSTGQNSADWNTWLNCVTTGDPDTLGSAPKPIGLFEFGYGVQSTGCSSGPESTRNSTMISDGNYLQGLESTINAPVVAWDYWWVDDTSVGPCHDWNFPATSTTASTWRGFETQNGGGAN